MSNTAKTPSNNLREVDQILDFVREFGARDRIKKLMEGSDREAMLFRALVDSPERRTDDEVMSYTDMDPRTHHKALSELKNTLYDAVLSLDLKRGEFDILGQKMYGANVRLARARALYWFRNGYASAMEAQRALDDALEVELWDVALSVIPILLQWAASNSDFERIGELLIKRSILRECQEALDICFEYWYQAYAILASSRSAFVPEVSKLCHEAIERVTTVANRNPTFRLDEFLLRFRAQALESSMNFEAALLISMELGALMERFPLFRTLPRRGRQIHTTVRLLLRLGKYGDVDAQLEAGEECFDSGSDGWFSFQALRLTYHMHLRRYEDAFGLVSGLRKRKEFSGISEPQKDEFKLALLYSEYFTKRRLSASFDVDKARAGDITRSLLAELPSFREDRAGHYVSVIILEVLICIESRRGRMYLIDRIESLVKFRNRHLKGQGTSQAAQFIEMLRLILKHDFNRQSFLHEAESLRQKLDVFDPTDTTRNELVMPYGVLWDEIVERLPNEPWLTD